MVSKNYERTVRVEKTDKACALVQNYDHCGNYLGRW